MARVKLDLSSSFSGRKEELALLIDSYETSYQKALPSTIFIEGEPGSGKSSLVEEFRERLLVLSKTKHKLGSSSSSPVFCFGRGIFEEGRSATEPFGAVVDAVRQIIRSILRTPEKDEWMKRLRESLRGEYRFLKDVKALSEIFCTEDDENDSILDGVVNVNICEQDAGLECSVGCAASEVGKDMSSDCKGRVGFERLCLVFRQILREISTRVPVILVMDDLQWAETDALALIQTILRDRTNKMFIFVGVHRKIFDENQDALDHRCSILKSFKQEVGGTNVSLGNLTQDDVSSLLCKVLIPREVEDVTPLADVIRRKTGGNALFVKQFILSLERSGFVWYSIKMFKWRWDLPRIMVDTELSSNVVKLVSSKIHQSKASYVLMIAALLGSMFINVDSLLCVLSDRGLSRKKLTDLLQEAQDEGLLDKLPESLEHDYKFSHDQIREGALSLLPTGQEQVEMRLRAGRQLRCRLSIMETEEMYKACNNRLLFQTITQMNEGSSLMKDKIEIRDLAELNYRAAKVAMERLSFFPAVDFLRKSIKLLRFDGTDPWEDANSFDMMMETNIALSRMEYCCGRLQQSVRIADTVLLHARSFEEKNLVAHTKILCLTQQQKKKEAINMVISILSELGVIFPRRFVKVHLVRQFLKTKKLMSGRSDEAILNLPWNTDKRMTFASEFLLRLGEISMSWGMEDHLVLSMLMGVELTIKKGRFGMTAMTLQAWGFILASEGSFAEAHRFGQLGMKMATERKGGSLDDRTMLLFYLWIFHWKLPYRDGVTASSRALDRLWEVGAIENVLLDTNTYLRIYFCSGLKLEPLMRDIKRYTNLCSDYQQEVMLSINLPFFQMLLNLMGKSNNTVDLTGELMNQAEYIKKWKKTNSAALQMLYFHRMMLAYYFNDYELAGQMSKKVTRMQLEGPEIWVPYRYFFKGLTAWSLAKITGKHCYVRKGQAVVKLLKKWVQQGVVNCHHMYMILSAEQLAASFAKQENVQKAYDAAIAATAKIGVLHDKALANEMAALYFLDRGDSKHLAQTYMLRARDCYRDWGAEGKAQKIEHKYKHLLNGSSHSAGVNNSRTAASFHAKTRLGNMGTASFRQLESSNHTLLSFRRQSDFILECESFD